MLNKAMPYRIVLFDRDGTLTIPASGAKFPKSVHDQQWMPGRLEKLQELHAQGVHTAIITNQGGAAWGIFTPEEMDAFLHKQAWQGEMSAVFVCYHDTSEKACSSDRTEKSLTAPDLYKGHERRKPGPGMLMEAMDAFEVGAHEVLYVGDREEDKAAAEAAGVNFEWAWSYFADDPITA